MNETFTHGRSAYLKNGCRCETCVHEMREYKRKYRVRKGRTKRILDGNPLVDRIERDGRITALHNLHYGRWREKGIEVFAADRWCIKLGYHPLEIWGQDFYVGVSEMDNEYD